MSDCEPGCIRCAECGGTGEEPKREGCSGALHPERSAAFPIELTEEERQTVLMALAYLSIERPGWMLALREVASKMDNKGKDGLPAMFEGFRKLRGLLHG